ncbi:MAG: DNA mismatch repair protein [Mucilaginibacter sp.]|uniref:MutS-related protein n=1 Tax=Mucilaginibacter sp. TaxID=1882438 RepID=UPI003266EEF6
MSFITDKQTLADLNILGKYRPNSIYTIFNQVRTEGGERLLHEMFQHPLTDTDQINSRRDLFKYFQEKDVSFSLNIPSFGQMEAYFNSGRGGNRLLITTATAWKKFTSTFLRDEEYSFLHDGLLATIEVLNSFRTFVNSIEADMNSPYAAERSAISSIFQDKQLQGFLEQKSVKQFSFEKVARYEHLLKHRLQQEIEFLINSLYKLDVYLTVSTIARQRNFSYALALPGTQSMFKARGLRHPALTKAVANSADLSKDQNLLFLTGANMAGKSTFMKACGIAIYLAHMGFPVAAEELSFSVMDGIYSSINVADDLNMGHSHFYAEVLRVKNVAKEVAEGRRLLVLFDELFKGTNVKDAYDGTLLVTAAFSKFRNCCFIVSTHIIEVGETLRQEGDHIRFAYLPTVMNGRVPQYTYQLTEGITGDRQGMMIIENEGILDILNAS